MTLEGDRLKDAGMAQAIAAVPTWSQLARAVIEQLADRGTPFTSEDVTRIVKLPRGIVRQNRNNAVGAVMAGAARRGIIRQIGTTKASRSSQHSAVIGVWIGTGES
jgi:hypothetical protein